MTQQIETNGKRLILVEVPENATCWTLQNFEHKFVLWFFTNEKAKNEGCFCASAWLTDFNWDRDYNRIQILGEIDGGKVKFDCSELVDGYEIPKDENDYVMRFRNYEIRDGHEHFASPQDSFLSLLKSQSIDTTKHYLVVEVKN